MLVKSITYTRHNGSGTLSQGLAAFHVAQVVLCQELVVQGIQEARIQFYGPVTTADGILVTTQAVEASAFVVPDICIAWCKLQGFVITDDGPFMTTEVVESNALVGPSA